MDSLELFFTGQEEVVADYRPVPPTLEPNEVLVRANYSLISTGTESICYRRLFDKGTHWDAWVQYPFRPGYSLAGEVVKVGAAVTTVAVGSRVAVAEPHRHYARVKASRLSLVPEAVPDEAAPWFALANITQIGVRHASPVLGETVAVVGLGLLGQLVTQYSRLLGAREVIAIDPSGARLDLARQSGATTLLPLRVQEARLEVMRLTDDRGVDLVYDVTGHAPVFAEALTLLRPFGRLVLLGDTGAPSSQHLTMDVIRKGLKIIGAHALHAPALSTEHAYWSNHKMTELFYHYLSRGDMNVTHLITHRFSPLEAKRVYDLLQSDRDRVMGVMFDWTGLP